MNNQTGRNKFRADYERMYDTCPRGYIVETGEYTNDHAAAAWWGFQAGAAYQRSIDKGLVEALENVEQEHILRSRMQDCVLRRNGVTFGIAVHSDKHAIEWQALGKELDAMITERDEALATYKAQEGK